jgi:hypothetical protein
VPAAAPAIVGCCNRGAATLQSIKRFSKQLQCIESLIAAYNL